ncbi:hypothetical protein HJC23_012505 [Cyclotella cryptica]|uniref:Uncharacterized protein n=1 Tax=Cyclotella cryptica TaxID=29204 RepID=A0ABD3PA59_9STRA
MTDLAIYLKTIFPLNTKKKASPNLSQLNDPIKRSSTRLSVHQRTNNTVATQTSPYIEREKNAHISCLGAAQHKILVAPSTEQPNNQ